jgi:porin
VSFTAASCSRTGRDSLGVGFAYYRISDAVRDAYRVARETDGLADAEPTAEAVITLTYSYHLAPWWTLQPDLQWIIRPGGSGATDDALVVGLRTTIVF